MPRVCGRVGRCGITGRTPTLLRLTAYSALLRRSRPFLQKHPRGAHCSIWSNTLIFLPCSPPPPLHRPKRGVLRRAIATGGCTGGSTNKNNGEQLVQGGLHQLLGARGVAPEVLLTKAMVSSWCKGGCVQGACVCAQAAGRADGVRMLNA